MSKRKFSSESWETISAKSDPGVRTRSEGSLSSQKTKIRRDIKLAIGEKFATWKSNHSEVSLEYLKAMQLTVKDFHHCVLQSDEYKHATLKAEMSVYGVL
jgi:hypothetical protein